MVGHPGETEEDFEDLKEFVRKVRFDRMGAFAYSEEEGTYAAETYEDSIPQEEKLFNKRFGVFLGHAMFGCQ